MASAHADINIEGAERFSYPEYRDGYDYFLIDGEIVESQIDRTEEINALMVEIAKTEYQRQRAAEYPDFRDYLDGVVKGDQAQVQKYIDDCLAVKAKYPKPE